MVRNCTKASATEGRELTRDVLKELGRDALLDIFDYIKEQQHRFIIMGEDGYDWGEYVVKILDPLGGDYITVRRYYKFRSEEEITLVEVMREAIGGLLEARPNFFCLWREPI